MFTRLRGAGRLDSPRPPLPPQTASFDSYVSQAFLELTWSKSVAFRSKQWRIQEFRNKGRGTGAVGSGDFFYAPSHIPNVFVVRVVNKRHIVNIACWSICVLCSLNLQTKTHQIFKRGGASPLCRSWIRLCEIRHYFILFPFFYAWFMACKGYT